MSVGDYRKKEIRQVGRWWKVTEVLVEVTWCDRANERKLGETNEG